MGAIWQFVSGLGPKQRKLGVVVLVCLIGALTYAFADDSDRAALAEGLRNPMSVFAARSPGARDAGALYQTKRRRAALARGRPARVGPVPHERVLSQERTRPAGLLPLSPLADAGPDALPLGAPQNLSALPGVPPAGLGPGFDVPPFAFGDGPPAAATPGQPELPSSPAPAVPECATWLMMIAGLGIAGIALRRRERAALPRPARYG